MTTCGQAPASANQPRWKASSALRPPLGATVVAGVVVTAAAVVATEALTTGPSGEVSGGAVVAGVVVGGGVPVSGEESAESKAAVTMMRFVAEYFGSQDVSVMRSSGVSS